MEETEGKIVQLIKNGRKGVIRALFSRFGLVLILLLIQAFILFGMFGWFAEVLPRIWGATILFMAVMVLYLLNTDIDPTAKITWLIVILLLPVFGALLFAFTQSEIGHRVLKKRVIQLIQETRGLLAQSEEAAKHLEQDNPGARALARYIARSGCFPIYENTNVVYFPSGEDKFQELLRQLEKAEKFIFLEYFILDEGYMWGRVLDILERKAKSGVEVRVIYDGTCEFALLPRDYPKRLHALGIQCKVFAPVAPVVSTYYNYRDHRKILVVDGKVAFTGGVNLADEYINKTEKYGHWKDTAIMVEGEAANSFTLLFLQTWNVDERDIEFKKYLINVTETREKKAGYIIPYGDCPLDDDKVGECVYMDILNRAHRYVHIMTPYLILDSEMETALKYAAQRGVEVNLILPGIPDKIFPYALAKTHYASLMKSGVQIYEYTPGFVHAKVFVSDDREAVVGTINLDYRSLYHHFECAAYMYGVDCIVDIESDFMHTLDQCRLVTGDTIWQGYKWLKYVGAVTKAVAPLL